MELIHYGNYSFQNEMINKRIFVLYFRRRGSGCPLNTLTEYKTKKRIIKENNGEGYN